MIRDQLVIAVEDALSSLGVDPVPANVVVERPARREHGDWSTNAALVSAKSVGRNPRELGQQLADYLLEHRPPHVEGLDIAGPGFVNFTLSPTWLHDVLTEVVTGGEDGYARLELGHGRSMVVEYVSANPTGPIHAGGGRWGAFGDTLVRILRRCGYRAHREYYINDRGVQTQLFGQSLVARKNGEEPPEGGYVGAYIEEWAAEMPADADPVEWGKHRSLSDAREVLGSMGVEFDTWSSEKAVVDSGAVERVLDRLRATGHVFEKPRGPPGCAPPTSATTRTGC